MSYDEFKGLVEDRGNMMIRNIFILINLKQKLGPVFVFTTKVEKKQYSAFQI